MMKIFALLAFVGVATALPSTADDIVPEGFDASGMAPPTDFLEVSAFDEAKATVQSMIQAGKDQGACADLAAATVKEVEDSVDAAQKVLPNGAVTSVSRSAYAYAHCCVADPGLPQHRF